MLPIEGEYLYNIAAGLGFLAYLMTNVLWLRLLLVLGAGFYIWAGISLSIDSMIGWHGPLCQSFHCDYNPGLPNRLPGRQLTLCPR